MGWVALVICRVVLGLVLLIAGFGKLRQLSLVSIISPRPKGPGGGAVAFMLPTGEILLGTLTLAGAWSYVTAPLTVLLFAVFTAYTLRRVQIGDRSPCNCFGQLSKSFTGVQTVIRNSVLLVFAAVLWATTLLSSGAADAGGAITVEKVATVAILASFSLVTLYLIDLLDPRLLTAIRAPMVRSWSETASKRNREVGN